MPGLGGLLPPFKANGRRLIWDHISPDTVGYSRRCPNDQTRSWLQNGLGTNVIWKTHPSPRAFDVVIRGHAGIVEGIYCVADSYVIGTGLEGAALN